MRPEHSFDVYHRTLSRYGIADRFSLEEPDRPEGLVSPTYLSALLKHDRTLAFRFTQIWEQLSSSGQRRLLRDGVCFPSQWEANSFIRYCDAILITYFLKGVSYAIHFVKTHGFSEWCEKGTEHQEAVIDALVLIADGSLLPDDSGFRVVAGAPGKSRTVFH